MRCRICNADCGQPVLASRPAVTSTAGLCDVAKLLFVCEACGHCQSPSFNDSAAFYDTAYRISLASDDHDQLYERRGAEPIFRTRKQAELVLAHASPPQGAAVLDYGGAKAATLAALVALRPDLRPHVFDVSADYVPHWNRFIPASAQATYSVPEHWRERFALVMGNFVLEHVEAPLDVLRAMAKLMAPDGQAIVLVPDAVTNPGDVIVADHVNHFSGGSLRRALASAGLAPTLITTDAFRGAILAVARRGEDAAPTAEETAASVARFRALARFWNDASERVAGIAHGIAGSPAAIYGAGVYGTWVGGQLGLGSAAPRPLDLRCYVDANPHVREADKLGLPVLAPEELPRSVSAVVAALNPAIAAEVMAAWQTALGRGDLRVWYPFVRPPR
jgi:SAM-dependent methyltransferase